MIRKEQSQRERGGSRLKGLLALVIVGAMIFSAIKIVPAYFNNYQFQDSMQSEARFALSYPKKDADQVRNDLWRKAQDLSIPLTQKEDIKVSVDQSNVTISVDYSVPVDLKVYQFTLQFHPHADNHTI
ncbi:MAG TPA: hypothetical protein VJR26_01135 [Candidatus Acidoferrales bacterium]|nr:hypothetical protein [Candidatus Acidoferrales bacterium]